MVLPLKGRMAPYRWSAAILIFSIATFSGINECRMASFKVEDGVPLIILCRHGIAAVLALSRTGLISPILVIAL